MVLIAHEDSEELPNYLIVKFIYQFEKHRKCDFLLSIINFDSLILQLSIFGANMNTPNRDFARRTEFPRRRSSRQALAVIPDAAAAAAGGSPGRNLQIVSIFYSLEF